MLGSILRLEIGPTVRAASRWPQASYRAHQFIRPFPSFLRTMATQPVTTSTQSDHYRLPLTVTPKHYDLTFQTDLEKLSFEGYAKVQSV